MNALKNTTTKRAERTPRINCPCGSTIACKGSLPRHLKTKRHQRFEDTGISAPKNLAEYQRRKYASNPEFRKKHSELCKRYYEQNKEVIRKRQNSNAAMKRFKDKKRK